MKLGGGGTNNLNRPRRVITGRVYEKFKPIFEWKQEDDHDNLLVYLLGKFSCLHESKTNYSTHMCDIHTS